MKNSMPVLVFILLNSVELNSMENSMPFYVTNNKGRFRLLRRAKDSVPLYMADSFNNRTFSNFNPAWEKCSAMPL